MASRVRVKRLKEELERRGLPIYGNKSILLERCRENGVTCSAPNDPDRSRRTLDPPPASIGVTRPDVLSVSVAPAGPSDTPDTTSAVGTPPVVEAGGAPTPAPAAAAAPWPAVGPTAAAVAKSLGRASRFSKHDTARLTHVLCKGEVAAGVVVSQGPMSRCQQDAR